MKVFYQVLCIALVALLVQSIPSNEQSSKATSHFRFSRLGHSSKINMIPRPALSIRGGAVRGTIPKKDSSQAKSRGPLVAMKQELEKVKPATRIHLLLALFCSLVHVLQFPYPAPVLFGLDFAKWYQVWRPFTSVAYFGPPSISMANNIYFLVRYGQQLENEFGSGQQAWFLLVQVALLSVIGTVLGFPYNARSLITAAIHVNCRLNPMEKMPFQFGLTIVSWQLPFCMMLIDCLSQQSLSAAWPHVLGIFTGHLYYFLTQVWPSMGGQQYLKAPVWLLLLLGEKPNSNMGVDFRKSATGTARPSSTFTSKWTKKLFSKKISGQRLGSKDD